ncbi:hypothetical protein FACUT_6805 [Fusarium acutatum]|uniref:Uncharacterized protein n=1 Tax=Fusarium acutatum TaxID=78861 RepID=A0A8H4JS12_9HYPO|nr:hypothetical protein FACUT_6805 [Fusarium acutatum]
MYFARYVWETFKSVCHTTKTVMLFMLPFYALTVLLGLIQGPIVAQWYAGTMKELARLLVDNLYDIKILEFVGDAADYSFVDGFSPIYGISQIQSPLNWISHLGLKRPRDWSTKDVENMASLDDLYWRRRPLHSRGEPWQQWVYLSAQMEPWRQPGGPVLHDPWDQAFLKVLEYRDKHENLGRSNFHYVSCHKSFLCGSWRVTAPALLHFSINATEAKKFEKEGKWPYHEPVSVRAFELPLQKSIIPGTFPSYFEQIRALTASNSTFWTTRDTYFYLEQVQSQALPMLKQLEKKYPRSYGLLVKAEKKWTSLWDMQDTLLISDSYLISFTCAAIPTYLFKYVQALFVGMKKSETSGTEDKRKDPLAQGLEKFLGALSDKDKEKCGKKSRGERVLRKIEAELAKDNWNTPEEIIKDLNSALGLDKDGKVKGRR